MMRKINGFTLIELVVVIVILGILAVTAAPKFLNLQDDARVSTLKGLAGAMKGAASIVYGKSAIAGIEHLESSTVSMGSSSINIVYGYPAATPSDLEAAVDGLSSDWVVLDTGVTEVFGISTSSGTVTYGYNNFACVVKYSQATENQPAIVTIENDTKYGDVIDHCTLFSSTN
ncbi:type II secretion system protein [Vibrio casei]|uniref:type II secretion system protein n=2 Tax=Vibrio TaxID=662 RepID=UPI003743237A